MCTITLQSFHFLIDLFLSEIICLTLHAQLKFLKAVWIIFGETKSVLVNGRPVCLVSEAEVVFIVIEFQSTIIKMRT